MSKSRLVFILVGSLLLSLATAGAASAQADIAREKIEARSSNRPLASLKAAVAASKAKPVVPGPPREVLNFRGAPEAAPGTGSGPDALLQVGETSAATAVTSGFFGASNNDNGAQLGFLVAPPDTDGTVGPNHFVQMINLLTTIFDKSGNIVSGPFASNAFWLGIGGNCEPYNQGDPIALYDEVADRWLVSQFAFPDNQSSFSQCVAISQTGDPTGAYNRYEFAFDSIGFNDYPKHGIVSDSITMIANLFISQGPFYSFGGTFLGVMDKAAMYAGSPASLLGFNIGNSEFGFVAGDLDGAGSAPALFATAMSTSNVFDIWQIDVDWSTESASANQIAAIPVTAFDTDLCSASREACVPQPDGGPSLEALSDRLMHRLQIRDFGSHRSMLATHTVDVGGGRAGIRWYEFRETGGTWSLYQEGTFAPNDGEHRWIPSIAMNSAGDIGLGYLLASTNTYVSTAAAGQTAANSGSGVLDSGEVICAAGSGVQTDVNRAGDYSHTSVDPLTDSFWHTNEVFTQTGQFQWNTFVCEFTAGPAGAVNNPPVASFTFSCTDLACSFDGSGSTDSDGTIQSYSWSFGDGGTASSVTATHTYAAGGDYTVTLTVTDDGNASDSDSQVVTVVDPNAANITLSASGYKVKGRHNIDLSWSGATSSQVDVVRDGSVVITTANDGFHTDATNNKGGRTYVYQVCEAGTSTCSNTATVVF